MTAPRQINPPGIELVKAMEGLRFDAYRDPVGIWTIGYGHTKGVQPGMTITEANATDFLRQDLAAAEGFVGQVTADVPTSDSQFSAMVSLVFNIGAGNFRGSTVLRMHRQGNYQQAADAFLLWDKGHVDGELKVLPGLLRRRAAERLLYLSEPGDTIALAAPRDTSPPDPDHSANDLNRAELERVRRR